MESAIEDAMDKKRKKYSKSNAWCMGYYPDYNVNHLNHALGNDDSIADGGESFSSGESSGGMGESYFQEDFNTQDGPNGRTRHYQDHFVNTPNEFNEPFDADWSEEDYESEANALALTPVDNHRIYACQKVDRPDKIAKYDRDWNEFVVFKMEHGAPVIFTYLRPNPQKYGNGGWNYFYGREYRPAKNAGLRILEPGEVY